MLENFLRHHNYVRGTRGLGPLPPVRMLCQANHVEIMWQQRAKVCYKFWLPLWAEDRMKDMGRTIAEVLDQDCNRYVEHGKWKRQASGRDYTFESLYQEEPGFVNWLLPRGSPNSTPHYQTLFTYFHVRNQMPLDEGDRNQVQLITRDVKRWS